MHELIFTTALKTFGTKGLGVVARTKNIPESLMHVMERFHRFDFFGELDGENYDKFCCYSHCVTKVNHESWHLITRTVTREGVEEWGRKRYLVHQFAIPGRQLSRQGGKKTTFEILGQDDNFASDWPDDSEPKYLARTQIDFRPTVAHGKAWKQTKLGNEGLRQWLDWSKNSQGPLFLIGDSSDQIFELFECASQYCKPATRNSISYTTALGGDMRGVSFDWIGLIRGTEFAKEMSSKSSKRVLDTNEKHSFVPSEQSRSGANTAVLSGRSNLGDFDASPRTKMPIGPRKSSSTSLERNEVSKTQEVNDGIPQPPEHKSKLGLVSTVAGLIVLLTIAGVAFWQLKQSRDQAETEVARLENKQKKLLDLLETANTTIATNQENASQEIDEKQSEIRRLKKHTSTTIDKLRTETKQLNKATNHYRSKAPLRYAICIDLQNQVFDSVGALDKSFRFESIDCNVIRIDRTLGGVSTHLQGSKNEDNGDQEFEIPHGRVVFGKNEIVVTLDKTKVEGLETGQVTKFRPIEFVIHQNSETGKQVERKVYVLFLPRMRQISGISTLDESTVDGDYSAWTTRRLEALNTVAGEKTVIVSSYSNPMQGKLVLNEKHTFKLPPARQTPVVIEELFGIKVMSDLVLVGPDNSGKDAGINNIDVEPNQVADNETNSSAVPDPPTQDLEVNVDKAKVSQNKTNGKSARADDQNQANRSVPDRSQQLFLKITQSQQNKSADFVFDAEDSPKTPEPEMRSWPETSANLLKFSASGFVGIGKVNPTPVCIFGDSPFEILEPVKEPARTPEEAVNSEAPEYGDSPEEAN